MNYMELAYEAAEKAYYNGEIPVGAVIVKNDQIISIAYNQKEKLKSPIKHAEIIAIEKACEKLDTWRLNDCVMYVTMEPCVMCCGAMIQSRINKIYYLIENEKFGGVESIKNILGNNKYNHSVMYEKYDNNDLKMKMQQMLRDFFVDKR